MRLSFKDMNSTRGNTLGIENANRAINKPIGTTDQDFCFIIKIRKMMGVNSTS